MPPRLDDAKRAAILTDIRAGTLARNAIARKHGVSASTVTRLADEHRISDAFDRSKAAAATRAREVDTAALRADLAARRAAFAVTLHDVAEREVAKMAQPALYWDWGGKDHDYDERTQPEPNAADRRAMMATAAQALDKSLKLSPPRDEAGEQSRSVIGRLMDGLARNYAERHGDQPGGNDA